MREMALPCIVCNQTLRNVNNEVENQPNDGTSFWTEGHYGSTVFDPMDGQALEVNICDACLLAAAKQGKVLWGRRYRQILCEGMVVGREWTPNRGWVQWNGDGHHEQEEDLHVEIEDLGKPLSKNVEWRQDSIDYLRAHAAELHGKD